LRGSLAVVAEIVLERIGVLNAAEFYREAALEMADDAALRAAERDGRANGNRHFGGDGGAGERSIHDPARDRDAGRQCERGARIAQRKALMPAIFGEAKGVSIGEPSELAREFVAAADGAGDGHGKPIAEQPNATALKPADMVDIGDDELAHLRHRFGNQGDTAGRHIQRLARMFLPVLQHVPAGESDLDALVLAPLLIERKDANRTPRLNY